MSHVATQISPEGRRIEILSLLEQQGEWTIEDLADRFSVSGMTIRRDLQELADAGKVLRTHGGAAPARRISFEFQFLERVREQEAEKEEIADAAMKLIRPGQSVLFDSGTTTLAIARRLHAIGELTVVTTSLPIASELFGRKGINVLILGGLLREDSPDMTGALTDNNLDMVRTDLAFIGADAIDGEGYLYNRSADLGRLLKRMAGVADRVYAVADHSKIGRHELTRFARLTDWGGLITDRGLSRSLARQLKENGVQLFQAPKGSGHV